jgi:aspartate/methionine/tyrosine aminotransferase
MDCIASRAKALLAANRTLVLDFLRSRHDLDCFIPEHGTTLCPRLKRGDIDALSTLLLEKYDTMIVPGQYFEMPQHFRLGLGIATDALRTGLDRLRTALDQL